MKGKRVALAIVAVIVLALLLWIVFDYVATTPPMTPLDYGDSKCLQASYSQTACESVDLSTVIGLLPEAYCAWYAEKKICSLRVRGPRFPPPIHPTDLVITLERTGCYGTCPAYSLAIHGDGTILYEGKSHVAVEGKVTSAVSDAQLQQLVDAFEEANYFSFKDAYAYGETDLPCATDHSSVTTSITLNERTKTIQDYHGCVAPIALRELEDKIDAIVNSDQWVKGSAIVEE